MWFLVFISLLGKLMIPYGKQHINQADIDAVVGVLQSAFLTQGEQVPAFEDALCAYTGADFAVAVNSATSALHLACLAVGLGDGDWLWTTPITFVASANCALYCGAKVDFVDIDPQTCLLSISALEQKLTRAKAQNRLPKVLIPVHLAGIVCDMQAIGRLAKQYGFYVIEDASHAIGAKYQNQPIGCCQYSDIAVFSFHPVKIITTAEGGAALTNHTKLHEKMQLLRSHGITRDLAQMPIAPKGDWDYQQILLGFNYRMTELQAALGISQLSRLDSFTQQRHQLVRYYRAELANLPLVFTQIPPEQYPSFHLFIIQLKQTETEVSHHQLFHGLREKGIGVNLHYVPVHLQPFYRNLGFQEGDFPAAEHYAQSAISLPLYPQLSRQEQNQVINVLRQMLGVRR